MSRLHSDLDAQKLAFEDFASEAHARLRRVLVAKYGVEVGVELMSEVLGYAWEHRAELDAMANPVGFLFRVAQSRARRYHRWERTPYLPPEDPPRAIEGTLDLSVALRRLSSRQRTVVLLVHGYGWSYSETAETLGVSVGSVRNQLHRAMRRLRRMMEVHDDH